MTREIELGKIVTAYNIIEGSNEQLPFTMKKLGIKFNGKGAFKISLLKARIKDLAASAEETRTSLIVTKYGTGDEHGNFGIRSQEMLNGFMQEYGEILNTKHVVDFMPLTFEDFADLGDVEVPVEFTDSLLAFFEM